jgi:outer membrane protein OmpA-like peptidoglycan-associated protein
VSPFRRTPLVATLSIMTAFAGCSTPPAEPRNFVVYFETGDASVTPTAQQVIATVATATHEHAPSKLVVEGHADGGTTSDAALADQRAIAVIHALVEDGIDANSIEKLQGAPPEGQTGVAAHQVIIRFVP